MLDPENWIITATWNVGN